MELLVLEEALQHAMGGNEGAYLVVYDLLFGLRKHGGNVGMAVEGVAKVFVYAFVHPEFRLLVALVVEVPIFFGEADIVFNHLPYFGDAKLVIA